MAEHNANVVFLRNLPYDVTDNQIREAFKDCGTIADIRIMMDRNTGLSRG